MITGASGWNVGKIFLSKSWYNEILSIVCMLLASTVTSFCTFAGNVPSFTASIIFSSSLHRRCVRYKSMSYAISEDVTTLTAHLATTEVNLNIELNPHTMTIDLKPHAFLTPEEEKSFVLFTAWLLVFALLVSGVATLVLSACIWCCCRRRIRKGKKEAISSRLRRSYRRSARKTIVLQQIYFPDGLEKDKDEYLWSTQPYQWYM